MPLTQTEFRKHFSKLQDRIYVNHAAWSPLSNPARMAMETFMQLRQEGAPDFWPRVLEELKALRGNYAKLIGTVPQRIAMMSNTVQGMNVLADGLDWRSGDEVILYEHEFPANVMPFLNLARRGVSVRWLKASDGVLSLERFLERVTPQTRLISVSSVQYLTGFRVDLKALGAFCHERDILLSVDAIQSVGVLATDVMALGVDFLAAGGHKWLMSPLGSGFCYLTEDLQARLTPGIMGYTGLEHPEDFDNFEQPLSEDARRYELGAPTALSRIGARAATDLLLQAGLSTVETHVLRLNEILLNALESAPYYQPYDFPAARRSGILVLSHRDPERNPGIFEALMADRVNLSMRGGNLRIAPHYLNTTEELQRLAGKLTQLA